MFSSVSTVAAIKLALAAAAAAFDVTDYVLGYWTFHAYTKRMNNSCILMMVVLLLFFPVELKMFLRMKTSIT